MKSFDLVEPATFEEALALLTGIESDLVSATADARDEIAMECQTIRSVVIALQDDSSRALALAEPCVQPRSADPWNANVASNVVRFGHWKAGNLEAFYAVPWIPYSVEDDTRNLLADVYRLCSSALRNSASSGWYVYHCSCPTSGVIRSCLFRIDASISLLDRVLVTESHKEALNRSSIDVRSMNDTNTAGRVPIMSSM